MKDTEKRQPGRGGVQIEEFYIYNTIDQLPFNEQASYVSYGMAGVCTAGKAIIEVFDTQRRVEKDTMLIIFPNMLVSLKSKSDDFAITFFKVSRSLYIDIISGLCRLSPDFIFYMRRNFTFRFEEHTKDAERFFNFCGLIETWTGNASQFLRRESLMQLLRLFYFDIYAYFRSDPHNAKSIKYTHKEDVALKFMQLIIQNFAEHREVAFYADKLCLTPKYLTSVVHYVSGKSAKDWIVGYLILEIKALLRNFDIDIKEIAAITKFPDQSLMSRFFRKHTGMSPSDYRESINGQILM